MVRLDLCVADNGLSWVGLRKSVLCRIRCHLYLVPSSTFGSVKSRRVYNFVWMLVGVILPLGCLLVAGIKLVQVLRALRQRNEIDTARHERRRRYGSRPSPVTTTVVGTAVSFVHNCVICGTSWRSWLFQMPNCAKLYISESWYRKHLSKCPKPTGAIMG